MTWQAAKALRVDRVELRRLADDPQPPTAQEVRDGRH
jgi:hypothetical protein